MESNTEREITWDFFIAHSHVDKSSALELYNGLKSESRVFLDEQSLLPGSDWDLEIPKVQRLSLITLALVSHNLNAAYYAREEVVLGIRLSRKNPNAHRVVPIYLNGSNEDIEDIYYGLRLKQGLDVKKEGGIGEVAKKLHSLINHLKGDRPQEYQQSEKQKSHVLLQFPVGPALNPETIRRSVIEAYATIIRRFEARTVIAEANAFRKEANPNDENVTTINFNYILSEDRVSPFEFWKEVFEEARLNGPRMLAALILSVPDDRFSMRAKTARAKWLDDLQNIKS